MSPLPSRPMAEKGTPSSESPGRVVALHPLAIVGISDHFTRVVTGGGRQPRDSFVTGLLFGKQSAEGCEVSILDAIELACAVNESGRPTIDHEFLKKQMKLFTEVYSETELVGWYCVAKNATDAHRKMHEEFLQYNESPLFLVMDPEPAIDSKELPILILERQNTDDSSTALAPVSFRLETLQAEYISMEQVAKTAPADGESGLDAHVETLDSSLTTLSQRVAAIVQYLKLVDEERAELDYGVLRQIADVCNQLPTGDSAELRSEFIKDYNDTLMLSYLANVTKSANAVNELSDKFMLIHNRSPKLV